MQCDHRSDDECAASFVWRRTCIWWCRMLRAGAAAASMPVRSVPCVPAARRLHDASSNDTGRCAFDAVVAGAAGVRGICD